MMRIKNQINAILARHTGQPVSKIEKDSDRDYFMTAEEAKNTESLTKSFSNFTPTRISPCGVPLAWALHLGSVAE